jgi:uncharacterized protein YeaO (DUF488 family)
MVVKWSQGIHVRKGALRGWHEDQSPATRRGHLREAAKAEPKGWTEISRRLTFIANVNEKQNPRLTRIARDDQKWVARNHLGRQLESNLREE